MLTQKRAREQKTMSSDRDETKNDAQNDTDRFDSGFNLSKECDQLDGEHLVKLNQMKEMGYTDTKLNFLKLNIYKWNLDDTVKFYEKDKFCWNYFIHQHCTDRRKCKKTHDGEMTLVRLQKTASTQHDWKHILYYCEYLISTLKYLNNAELYHLYGKAYRKLDNFILSERLLSKSIQIDPNRAVTHNIYAMVIEAMQKNLHYRDEQVKIRIHFQKAIDLKPNYHLYWGNMASYLIDTLHQYRESLHYSKKALSLNSTDASYAYLIGEAYYYLKQWLLAKQYYEKTLKLGHASSGYGFKQTIIEARIKEINWRVKEREQWDKLCNTLMNDKMDNLVDVQNDKNYQIKFFMSCIDSRMSFDQLSFLIERFTLSKEYFQEAIRAWHAQVEKEKGKSARGMAVNLREMQKSIWKTIEWSVEAIQYIDSVVSINTVENNIERKSKDSNDTGSQLQLSGQLSKTDQSQIGNIKADWEKDSNTLTDLCNKNDLDLNKYFETMKLIEIQEKRLKDEFYGEIRKQNKQLFDNKKLMAQAEKLFQECQEIGHKASQQIIQMQTKYNEELQQLSKIVRMCFKLKTNQWKQLKVVDKQQESLIKHRSTIDQCKNKKEKLTSSLEKYRNFETLNHGNIAVLKQKYNDKWQQFEKMWYKWKIPEISMFLKYKLTTMGKIQTGGCEKLQRSDNEIVIDHDDDEKKIQLQNNSNETNMDEINWDEFEENLRQEKFKSKYLQMIDKSELKSFGIVNYKLRNDIYKIIQNVCKNNPIPIAREEENNNSDCDDCEGQVMTNSGGAQEKENNKSIDPKYLCPLTEKVMLNPVIAFDDQCYDKDAIISYLRQYKESPVTKEKIDDVEWAIQMLLENKNLKQEIKHKGLL